MATISENLEILKTAKTSIKSAIEGKGQDLTDVPFTQYGEKIASIQASENLDTELNEQDALLEELHTIVDELPETGIDLGQTTATIDDVREGKVFVNSKGQTVTGTYKDMLQKVVDTAPANKACQYLFYNYGGTDLDFIKDLDVSRATSTNYMFAGCGSISNMSFSLNSSNATTMRNMFSSCSLLQTIPKLDTSKTEDMSYMFESCQNLKSVTELDTKHVYHMSKMFTRCSNLETVSGIDLINGNTLTNMFDGCSKLKNLTLKNIKKSITIGSGTSYGHLLTLDSLLNTIKELWTNTDSSTLTLTMGTTNTAKLADVYVKLIPITDEMRAEDEYIDNKAPFEVCESTDEGAMLITEYVTTVKKWTLA